MTMFHDVERQDLNNVYETAINALSSQEPAEIRRCASRVLRAGAVWRERSETVQAGLSRTIGRLLIIRAEGLEAALTLEATADRADRDGISRQTARGLSAAAAAVRAALPGPEALRAPPGAPEAR